MRARRIETSVGLNESNRRAGRTWCGAAMIAATAIVGMGCDIGPGLPSLPVFLPDGVTELVSRDEAGRPYRPASGIPSLSHDGRFVAFARYDADITSDEVFVLDRDAGTVQRVSVATDGSPGDDGGEAPSLSADGRFVVFASDSTNLVDGDDNARADIFLHDRATGETRRISESSPGRGANNHSSDPVISADGSTVVFFSYASDLVDGDDNGLPDYFKVDPGSGEITRVNVSSDGDGDDGSGGRNFRATRAALSETGRYVAFASAAVNLVEGDRNGQTDVFVHDCDTATTVRVSVASGGAESDGASLSPSISGDGRFVAFESAATNLGGPAGSIVVHDRDADGNGVFDETGDGRRETAAVPLTDDSREGGQASLPSLSADGGRIAYFRSFSGRLPDPDSDRTFFDDDAYVFDRASGVTRRVSADMAGLRVTTCLSNFQNVPCGGVDDTSNAVLSGDGLSVAFLGTLDLSYSERETHIFVESLSVGP